MTIWQIVITVVAIIIATFILATLFCCIEVGKRSDSAPIDNFNEKEKKDNGKF
jgi:hypothetical protein